MDFNTIVDELAVNYSMTGDERALTELLAVLTPAIKAKARNFNCCVPSVTKGEFEALLRECVWKACRNGSLSNFDPNKGHVMPRIYTFWRWAMLNEAGKARQRQPVSLDALPTCPPALVAQFDDTSEINDQLRRFRLMRPMDYVVIAALIDGAGPKELAKMLGRPEYDPAARMRVLRARKAFGKLLCG